MAINEQTCPHCGYCPTCGRSNRPWRTYPPFAPYPQVWWYSAKGGSDPNGTVTVSCSHTSDTPE